MPRDQVRPGLVQYKPYAALAMLANGLFLLPQAHSWSTGTDPKRRTPHAPNGPMGGGGGGRVIALVLRSSSQVTRVYRLYTAPFSAVQGAAHSAAGTGGTPSAKCRVPNALQRTL